MSLKQGKGGLHQPLKGRQATCERVNLLHRILPCLPCLAKLDAFSGTSSDPSIISARGNYLLQPQCPFLHHELC